MKPNEKGAPLLNRLVGWMRFLWRRPWGKAVCLVLGLLVLLGGYAGALQIFGNFHTVVDGQLYRVAQPSARQIEKYARLYGIRTVLNLRGDNTGSPWYDNEVAASKKLGLNHVNFRMSARRELSQERAIELVSLLRHAPKPILVHCNGGADRSGLVSALFLATVAQRGEEESEKQLSFRFGHVSIPYLSSSFAMDRTFENLEPWLGFDGS